MSLHQSIAGGFGYGLLGFSLAAAGLITGVVVVFWLVLRSRRLNYRVRALRGALAAAARHDRLTGLLTRGEFEEVLESAVLECDRHNQPLTLLYLGLDGLGGINEGFGHASGDIVLRELGSRLATIMGEQAVARVAGDEFALIMVGALPAARERAAQLLQALQRPVSLRSEGASTTFVTASIGLAQYPIHGARTRLMGNAHLAMQTVKASGGNAHADYEPSMGVDHRERMLLRNDLANAVERRQFELVYQPKVDARTLQITGAEALLRWNLPGRGMVSPAVFIPLAERHGLIGAIGNWVIDEACRQAAVWREAGLRMRVAVNISGYQIRQDDLVDRIVAALRRHDLQPERFTCEITESVAMEDTQVTRDTFERLRAAGLKVSIDDFGTGHSSLASLRRLPAEELKIDRAFVSDLATSADARSIAAAVVQMAHTLDLRVVAEGVETEVQRDLLIGLGCDQMQGYLFAKPMSAAALVLWADNDGADQRATFSDSLFKTTNHADLS